MSAVSSIPYIPPYIPNFNLPDTVAGRLADVLGYIIGTAISVIPATEVQKALSRFQITPIIGPLIGSPIKALYSTAQIIFGIALMVLFGPIAHLTHFCGFINLLGYGAYHMGLGLSGLATSAANFANFGGSIAENEFVILPASYLVALMNRIASQNSAQSV